VDRRPADFRIAKIFGEYRGTKFIRPQGAGQRN
jgi:hypothetical protein